MLTSEYSLWFLPLCVAIGLAYAAILYYKIEKPELPLWVKRTVFALRTLAMSILAFLLLNPLVKSTQKEKIKPIILVGVDNSASIRYTKDSLYYKQAFQQQLQGITQSLGQDYQVETILMGDTLRNSLNLDFEDKKSNLADIFDYAQKKYINRNLGAVVFISDGIFNAGSHPLYAAEKLSCPIYTVALGDTTVRRDLLIAKVNHNQTVFKNNFFPIEILVQANKLTNQTTQLRVYNQKEDIVFEKNIHIRSHAYMEWVKLNLEAKEAGMYRYSIKLSPVEDEMTTENNTTDIFIQVVDERKKIALIYNTPHPDVSAIVQSIQENETYKIETFSVDKFNTPINEYDFIILHQLPSRANPIPQMIEAIKKIQLPVFFILGKQTNYNQVATLNTGIQIQLSREMYNDVYPIYNQNFSTFSLSNTTLELLKEVPPIQAPFANYKLASSADVLLSQKIGNVQTNYPLLYYNQIDNHRTAVCLADGIWKWKMYNYMLEENHNAFNEIIYKTIQYLSLKEDKNFFRVSSQHVFNENESVIFDAELYNQNYELINDPEVNMQLWSDDKKFSYTFTRTFKAYHLDIGGLPIGDYKWKAKVKFADKTYEKSGYFSVKKVNIETINLIADHQLLKNIANLNQGAMFYPRELDKLEKEIKNNEQIVSIVRYNKKHNSLLNSFFVIFSILLFLSTEWVLRKWSGSY